MAPRPPTPEIIRDDVEEVITFNKMPRRLKGYKISEYKYREL